jgi:hypothetical protein
MQTQRDGSGILFANDRRENDRQPTHRGSITVAGVEYYLSGWIKEGRNGKFLSLAVPPKTATTHQADNAKPNEATAAPWVDTRGF